MFVICSAVASSQARVGVHISSVKTDFPAIVMNDDSTYSWVTENAYVRYITDSLGFVSETIIYPLTLKDEKIYLAYYNSSFEKRNSASWVFYDKANDDSCYITVVRKGSGIGKYFIWSKYDSIKRSYREVIY